MVKTVKKRLNGRGKKIGIVASRFNEYITKRLLNGCHKQLLRAGVKKNDITTVWVPGSFEIPVVALKLTKKKNIQAVICLGAVIRGETLHFGLVAQGAAQGIARASLLSGKPVIFGVLATETVDQAYKRSEEKGANKGRDAAETAIEMINIMKQL
jgi:6,7-dimethyl-8-ribityllumazine synthase